MDFEVRTVPRPRWWVDPPPPRPRSSLAEHAAKRAARRRAATPSWADRKAIASVYAERDRLNRRERRLYRGKRRSKFVVDHILPLQGVFVCGLHLAANLRVVRASENARKHNKTCDELDNGAITRQCKWAQTPFSL